MLLDLVLCYERADWQNITNYAEILGVPTNMIAQIYFNCVEEVNTIWETITNSEEDEKKYKEATEALEEEQSQEVSTAIENE